jgi:4a-hydroxytetrahydrobiopterin dehydratase
MEGNDTCIKMCFVVVQVVLSTHAIGGLSLPDFIMAAKLDELPVVYSPKWLEKQQASK